MSMHSVSSVYGMPMCCGLLIGIDIIYAVGVYKSALLDLS